MKRNNRESIPPTAAVEPPPIQAQSTARLSRLQPPPNNTDAPKRETIHGTRVASTGNAFVDDVELDELEDEEELQEEDSSLQARVRRIMMGMPAWLFSMIIHVAALLLLAIIPLSQHIGNTFVISLSQGTSEALQDFEVLSEGANDSILDSATNDVALDVPVVEDFSETLIADLATTADSLTQAMTPASKIESGLSGRSGTLKSTLLAAYGGTAETERSVEEGLAWLARRQRGDGSWSLRGPYTNGGVSENKAAATAMALIAFAGAGYHHQDGKYQTTVSKGLKYLLQIQDNEGWFGQDSPDRQMMYAQGQATIALCELYGMTKDPTLRNKAQLAIDFAEAAQSREGGWRYIPREDSDTSVTGWFVMALMSGKMAGLSTSNKVLDRVNGFLDRVQYDSGSRYGYVPNSGPFPTMSAEGLLCREYLGWKRTTDPLARGCEQLARQPISASPDERSYYYWYYATQALHHYGGQPWETWNAAMVDVLPKLQVQETNERGSWPPQHDPYGNSGGRLYATCFAIYCLEVYYRHLPLYSFKEAVQ
jgi:hypothetical protein